MSVVRPRAELERTALLVEREVRDVNLTRTLRHRRNRPHDVTLIRHDRVRLREDLSRRLRLVDAAKCESALIKPLFT